MQSLQLGVRAYCHDETYTTPLIGYIICVGEQYFKCTSY